MSPVNSEDRSQAYAIREAARIFLADNAAFGAADDVGGTQAVDGFVGQSGIDAFISAMPTSDLEAARVIREHFSVLENSNGQISREALETFADNSLLPAHLREAIRIFLEDEDAYENATYGSTTGNITIQSLRLMINSA